MRGTVCGSDTGALSRLSRSSMRAGDQETLRDGCKAELVPVVKLGHGGGAARWAAARQVGPP